MIAALVAASLVLADAPLDPCPADDERCRAEDLEARAVDATSPATAAKLLRAALRSRLSTFERTEAPEDLCAARATAEMGRALEDQPETSRRDFVAHVDALDARAEALGLGCDTPTSEGRVPLLDPHGSWPADVRGTSSDGAGDRAYTKRRPAVIGGSIAVAGGVALLGAATFGGVEALAALREGRALAADYEGRPADAAALQRDATLRAEYRSMANLALGAGIAGGVAVVVGGVLLGVSRPRRSAEPRRATLTPSPGGLVLSGRF